ncbi:MAG: exodeoxyribonuclease VII small subunit [Planctomycetota bacterium]
MAKAQQDATPPEDGPSFEDAMAEVEAIIERIETGEAGLERSIGDYEKGMRLLKRCRSLIEKAEQRIEDVTSRLEADDAAEPSDVVD